MRIELLDEVNSTNLYIQRYLPLKRDVIVCASIQSNGMGTKGRSFISGFGGVYLSKLSFYENFSAREAFTVMTDTAVAVCKTAERFGANPEIKWPNDILVNGKKLCGILIENGLSNGFLTHSVVGIGLNVCNDLSALGGIAISLAEATGQIFSVEEVREELIAQLQIKRPFADYSAYLKFIGKEISVTEQEKTYRAVARAVLPDGRLQVEVNGEIKTLSSAEIKIWL